VMKTLGDAANLGRSRLYRRPEPAESRLRAELPALQGLFSTVPPQLFWAGVPDQQIQDRQEAENASAP
jgi:hypothetical protein